MVGWGRLVSPGGVRVSLGVGVVGVCLVLAVGVVSGVAWGVLVWVLCPVSSCSGVVWVWLGRRGVVMWSSWGRRWGVVGGGWV